MALDAYATTRPSWIRHASSPFCDASACICADFRRSKGFRTGVDVSKSLIFSKAASCSVFQLHSASFLRSSRSGAVMVDSCGIKRERYWTIPRYRLSSPTSLGFGMCTIALIFSGSTAMPVLPRMCPRYFTDGTLYWIFRGLKRMLCSMALFITSLKIRSCSSSESAAMRMSSALQWTPGILPNISLLRLCNTSLAHWRWRTTLWKTWNQRF